MPVRKRSLCFLPDFASWPLGTLDGIMDQQNRLMEALTPESRRMLLALAKRVDLSQGATLYEPDESAEYAYFLTSGVASMTVTVPNGGSAEIGMVGSEGVTGVFDLLGSFQPVANCFMQTNGSALRVPMADLRRLFHEIPEIRNCILEAIQQQMLTVSRIAACNKLHRASERLARWLLMASDRTGSDVVSLTQESLAAMLGTRRTTVALVAGTLQRSGMIRYRRGTVSIMDRESLVSAACDCYAVVTRLADQLYRVNDTTPTNGFPRPTAM